MKTITLIAVALFFSINVFSQEIKLHEIQRTEKTVYSKTTDGIDVKILYHYNNDDLLTERIMYIDNNGYWQPTKRTVICYGMDNIVKNIFYIKWDKDKSRWKDQLELQTYYYDEKGSSRVMYTRESSSTMKKLLAVKQD